MVTLHHFVQPLWFDRLGGFTDGANIPHFVRFAELAFRLDAPRCPPSFMAAELCVHAIHAVYSRQSSCCIGADVSCAVPLVVAVH